MAEGVTNKYVAEESSPILPKIYPSNERDFSSSLLPLQMHGYSPVLQSFQRTLERCVTFGAGLSQLLNSGHEILCNEAPNKSGAQVLA